MKPTVSIIIVVKNDPGIADTLRLIGKQTYNHTFETIVVDASAPERLQSVRKKFPHVRWEYYDQAGKRFTITEQRNLGLKLAKGDIIVFIDASCHPSKQWLATLVSDIAAGEDIVTGPCHPSNKSNLVQYIQDHDGKTYVQECTTINVALRRRVADAVAGFDESLDYGEDVDFFWRAIDAGYKICFDPKAVITHDYGDADEQLRRAYRYGKSRAVLHKRHWRTRWYKLLRYEPHVWIYPLFIIGLPLALVWPYYLLVLVLLAIKNRSIKVVFHHLVFGLGVIVGAVRS